MLIQLFWCFKLLGFCPYSLNSNFENFKKPQLGVKWLVFSIAMAFVAVLPSPMYTFLIAHTRMSPVDKGFTVVGSYFWSFTFGVCMVGRSLVLMSASKKFATFFTCLLHYQHKNKMKILLGQPMILFLSLIHI